MRSLLFDALPCPDSVPRFQCGDNEVHITIIWQRRLEILEPWTFLCIGTALTLASLEAKCRSNPTTAQTSSPEATLRCNDYSINYSSAPAFHMRYIHPPPFFLVTANLETKDSRNVRNCGIHFSEIVSLSCKIAPYIIYLSKTCYSFIIT